MPTEQLNDDHLRDVLDKLRQNDLNGILALCSRRRLRVSARPAAVGYTL